MHTLSALRKALCSGSIDGSHLGQNNPALGTFGVQGTPLLKLPLINRDF
jgi:hypothetical protein